MKTRTRKLEKLLLGCVLFLFLGGADRVSCAGFGEDEDDLPPPAECSSNADCPGGFCNPDVVCFAESCPESAGHCVAASCGDGSALTCRMLEPACLDGFVAAVKSGCWACVDPATCEEPLPPGTCQSDADCAPNEACAVPMTFAEEGLRCGPIYGQCVANPNTGCTSDADCAPGELCESMTACAGCSDGACPTVCETSNHCVPAGCEGAWMDETGTCRAPNDGGYPDHCCVPPPPPGCGSDAECPSGFCMDGRCTGEELCPLEADPGVTYMSHDPHQCAAMDFMCPADTGGFSGACGCGCIASACSGLDEATCMNTAGCQPMRPRCGNDPVSYLGCEELVPSGG